MIQQGGSDTDMVSMMTEKATKREKTLTEEIKSVSRIFLHVASPDEEVTLRQYSRAITRLKAMPESAQQHIVDTVSKEINKEAANTWVLERLDEEPRRRIANQLKIHLNMTKLTYSPYHMPY